MSAKPWVVQPLRLPVGDTEYVVQPIGYEDGLTLLNVGKDKNSQIKKDAPDEELFKLVLGEVWDTMLADKQPYPAMFRAGTAALHYQTALVSGLSSEDAVAMGEAVWESGLSPEAVAAALAATRNQATPAKPSKTSTRSTSTAGASGTRRQASTSGTRSRKTTPRTTPAKKAAGSPSVGKRSPRPSSGR